MNAIWILTKLTFREAMRRRIMLAGLILGISFIVIYSLGLHFILTQIKNVASSSAPSPSAANILNVESMNGFLMAGLYAVTFLSIAMAALLGADTLAGEINSGTVQTIVTKPIRRADVVLGKWLGFAGLLGLYILLMAGGIVLSMFIQAGYCTIWHWAYLHGVPADHDDHADVLRRLPCTRDRRYCLWTLRSILHRRLDRTDRRGAS